jgi:hypothetical protein
MSLASLRRWHWAAIGTTIGLIAGGIRANFDNLDLYNASGGERQAAFEQAVLTPVVYDGVTYPQWKDLYVLRVADPAANGGLRYTVIGQFHETSPYRTLKRGADGKPQLTWSEHFFKAPLPYVPLPTTALPQAAAVAAPSLGGLARIAELLHLKEPEAPSSVLAFLDRVRAAHPGFSYSYHWWRRPRITVALWTAGMLLLVGGVWPFIASLIAFGTLLPPPREKRAPEPPRPAAAPAPPIQHAKPKVDEAALAHLRELEAELEASLSAESATADKPARPTSKPPAPSPSPAPQVLTGQRLEAAQVGPTESKVYEAKQDDFYPTERHHKPDEMKR